MPQPGEIRTSPTTGRRGQWDGTGWRILPDGNVKDPQYKEAAASIGKERTAYLAHRSEGEKLRRAAELNARVGTGGFLDQPSGEKDLVNFKQLRSVIDPNYNDLQNLSSQLQIGNKPEGQDSQVSNFERQLIGAGAPSVSNHARVNASIIGQRQGLLNEQGDKVAFMDEWLNTHGNLSGAAEKWAEYTTRHPYYGRSKDGKRTVEYYDRPVAWRDYLYGRQPAKKVEPPRKASSGNSGNGWKVVSVK